MASEMNIFQKMNAIVSEIEQKKQTKSTAGKAPIESEVLAMIKPLEQKHGIYSFPIARELIESKKVIYAQAINTSARECMYVRMKVVYAFVNIDKPDEKIITEAYGDGIDSGDKAPGKAMTYADKYALMKAYKIGTSQDPDQCESGAFVTATNKSAQPLQSQNQQTTKTNYKIVIDCLKETGSPWKPSDVTEWIVSRTGRDTKVNNLSDDVLQELLTAIKESAGEN